MGMFPVPTEPGDDDCAANAADEAKQVFPPEFHTQATQEIRNAKGGQPARTKMNQTVHNRKGLNGNQLQIGRARNLCSLAVAGKSIEFAVVDIPVLRQIRLYFPAFFAGMEFVNFGFILYFFVRSHPGHVFRIAGGRLLLYALSKYKLVTRYVITNCHFRHFHVPYIAAAHEVKTKPTQHSVKELRSFGIQPDIIVLRSDHHIDDAIRGKIASFCDVDTDCVFTNEDCASIYDVPQLLAEQDFDLRICERLGLDPRERDMSEWNEFLRKQNHANQHADKVKIAVVGKYTQLPDAYLSVIEALHHAGVFYDRHVDVQLVDGESLDEQNVSEVLGDASGILVPGGFGKRALEGKILAAEFAREHKIPYLGICLGMQVAVCEFARNVVGLAGASSSEFDPDGPYSVIDLMSSQEDVTEKGGTMRLGAYPCKLAADSLAREAYGEELVYERHRHRFEFNNAFRDQLEDAGLVISGLSPDERLVEMVELPRDVHPWYVATQAHPEFKSRPTNPQPLFREFVRASIGQHEGVDRVQVTPKNLATD